MRDELFADYDGIHAAAAQLRSLASRVDGAVSGVQRVAQPASGSREVDAELAAFTADALTALRSVGSVLGTLAQRCDHVVDRFRSNDDRLSDQLRRPL